MIKNQKINVNSSFFIVLIILPVIAIGLCSSIDHSSAANVTINNTTSDGIKGAINNGNDTIYLNPGVYSGINNTLMPVNGAVTIIGNSSANNVIINGNGNRIFSINILGNLTLINVTLFNCSGINGGAIGNENLLTLINCSFINNSATNFGGAIFDSEGDINVINSTFINNTAFVGGAIYSVDKLLINNSTFINNNANSGGAIHSDGSLNLTNSKFISNTANSTGGAIYNQLNASINNSNFTNNNAPIGGAIFSETGSITINNSLINNNSNGIYLNTTDSTISNSNITNNTDYGIHINGNNNNVSSSNIISNGGNGLELNGNNNLINYNRIFNNAMGLINNGINNNANLNWWGQNNALSQVNDLTNNLNINIWYVIQVSANGINRTTSDTLTFNASNIIMNIKLITNIPTNANNQLLPYFPITITNPNNVSFTTNIRNADYSYLINGINGSSFRISGLSDNEDITLTVQFVGNSTPPIPPIPVPPTPKPTPIDNNSANAAMKTTGNPVALLLISIISIAIIGTKRRFF